MRWFRLYSEVVDDPKLTELNDHEFRSFIYLLCLASEREREGLIDLTSEKITWRLRISMEDFEVLVKKLVNLKILSNNGKGLQFINWRSRQFRSDTSKHRTREWRRRQSDISRVTSPKRHVRRHGDGPETETETENNTVPKGTVVFSGAKDEKGHTQENPSSDLPDCPHQAIIDLYHMCLPECTRVKRWTEERQKNLRTRWHEDPKRQNLAWWQQYFLNVRQCFWFLDDREGDWKPDLEWLVKKGNLIKVIEGRYLPRGK